MQILAGPMKTLRLLQVLHMFAGDIKTSNWLLVIFYSKGVIASGTRWFTNPPTVFLASFLQPVVKTATAVAVYTQDVLDHTTNE